MFSRHMAFSKMCVVPAVDSIAIGVRFSEMMNTFLLNSDQNCIWCIFKSHVVAFLENSVYVVNMQSYSVFTHKMELSSRPK